MKHLFVRELCALLHELHITQDAIAAHLHVARSSVAGWTGGQRPVPHRHAAAFLAFARSQVHAACEAAWQENIEAPEHRSLLRDSSARRFVYGVNLQLRRWEVEIYATTGRLDAEYAHYASLLKPYLHLPPSKLALTQHSCHQPQTRT